MRNAWMKALTVFLVMVLVLSVAGCGANQEPSTEPSTEPSIAPSAEATPEATPEPVNWPTDTVTILVGNKAGGNVDIKARLIAKYLEPIIGQPVVVENVAGAAGVVAATQYLEEEPNTNKLFYMLISMTTMAPLYSDVAYTNDDFTPVAAVDSSENALFVKTGRFANLDELLEYGKDNLIKFGSGGPGNANYLIQKALFTMASVDSDTVTQTNSNEGFANVVAGTTDVVYAAMNASALDYVNDGSLTPIASLAEAPYTFADIEVPTLKSLGYALEFSSFTYMAIRAGTDDAIVQYINDAINSVYEDPAFQEEAAALELNILTMEPSVIKEYMDNQVTNIKSYFDISNEE